MKPDKHKQKRTKQYQKKHGIKDGKPPDKSNSTTKTDGSRPQNRQNVHPSAGSSCASNSTSTKSHSPMLELGLSDDSSDSENENLSTNRSTFKKRVVVSNWERYAGIAPEPEPEEPKGADFRGLLEAASNASSQFRFADEKLWDEELSSTEDVHAFLSIDTNDLADALDCVPLHRKLNVEASVFQRSDIEMFEQAAEQKKKLYLESREKLQKDTVDKKIQGLSQIWDDSDTILDDLQNSELLGKEEQDKHTVVELGGGFSIMKTDNIATKTVPEQSCDSHIHRIEDDLDKLLSSTDPPISVSNSPPPLTNTEQERKTETDLNDILDLTDTKQEQTNKNVVRETNHNADSCVTMVTAIGEVTPTSQKDVLTAKKTTRNPAVTKVVNLEDELDKLLSLDTDTTGSNTTPDTHPETTGNNDIEDWLDSVLDD